MIKFLETREIASKWNVSVQHVCALCSKGFVKGAKKENGRWLIPETQIKPSKKKNKETFSFIDLFAGIGGFHQAMRFLGGKCLMASEINAACVETYKLNFKTKDIRGDIRKIEASSIKKFDVLCAGFPCQPFSKAGYQKGFEDEGRGNLFFNILRILDGHKEVKFIVLENVRNLADKPENWDVIRRELMKRDFFITEKPIILSPSNFGIPQIRERVYILGMKKSLRNTKILKNDYIHVADLGLENIQFKDKCKMGDAFSVLENNVPDKYIVDAGTERMIRAWEEFREKTHLGKIGFPIWIKSFGYKIDDEDEFLANQDYFSMPSWKQRYVMNNRNFYLANKTFIDKWIERHKMLEQIKLFQKFEWNCGTDVNSIYDAIIQVRQSGIRAKRPTYYPALVAMVNTPIIYDKQKKHFRFITPKEAANLQNFNKRFKFSGTDKQSYKQLGNSVNVKILKILGTKLFGLAKEGWGKKHE